MNPSWWREERGSVFSITAAVLAAVVCLSGLLAAAVELGSQRLRANQVAYSLAVRVAAAALQGVDGCTAVLPPAGFELTVCLDEGGVVQVGVRKTFDPALPMGVAGESRVGYGATNSGVSDP